jgi:hypothetical protein
MRRYKTRSQGAGDKQSVLKSIGMAVSLKLQFSGILPLKTEAISSSETLVPIYRSTLRHIQEGWYIYVHCVSTM